MGDRRRSQQTTAERRTAGRQVQSLALFCDPQISRHKCVRSKKSRFGLRLERTQSHAVSGLIVFGDEDDPKFLEGRLQL